MRRCPTNAIAFSGRGRGPGLLRGCRTAPRFVRTWSAYRCGRYYGRLGRHSWAGDFSGLPKCRAEGCSRDVGCLLFGCLLGSRSCPCGFRYVRSVTDCPSSGPNTRRSCWAHRRPAYRTLHRRRKAPFHHSSGCSDKRSRASSALAPAKAHRTGRLAGSSHTVIPGCKAAASTGSAPDARPGMYPRPARGLSCGPRPPQGRWIRSRLVRVRRAVT
jgi:hypothetical protein